MFIGTQYLRPPNPPRGDWGRDLCLIKEHGLKLVRVWIYWGKVNLAEGSFGFGEYDDFFDLAEDKGLMVLAQLMIEGAPYWLERSYPNSLYVDRDGRKVRFRAEAALAVGGYPGPCLDNPDARRIAEDFIARTVKRYGGRGCLYAWDVWNEVWRHWPCYCDSTQTLFRDWLRWRYGAIGKLNERWQRGYEDFCEVEMPRYGQYADMVDLYEFVRYQAARWMRWRVDAVRGSDDKHLIVSHHLASCVEPNSVDDDWLLAEPLDVWGTSCYLLDYYRISLRFNSIRCSAKGKPWWLSEHAGGRTWSYIGDYLRKDAELRSMLLLALSHRAKGAIFWQWRCERFGEESPNFGLTNQAGGLTSRTEAVKKFCHTLEKYKEVLEGLEWPEPEIGILWEPKSYLMEKISYWDKGMEPLGPQNLFGYYKALVNEGVQADILNAREVVEGGLPKHVKVLLAPYQVIDREGLYERVEGFVKEGGVLIAGPLYGLYGDDTYASNNVPPEDMQKVLGVSQEEVYYIDKPEIDLVKKPITNGIRSIKGFKVIESYKTLGAEALGMLGEHTAIALNNYGRGFSITIGSFLGNAYEKGFEELLPKFLSQICTLAGIKPEIKLTGGVFGEVAYFKDKIASFIHNPTEEAKQSYLTIRRCGEDREVLDLMKDGEIGVIGPGKPLKITLPPRDSTILLC